MRGRIILASGFLSSAFGACILLSNNDLVVDRQGPEETDDSQGLSIVISTNSLSEEIYHRVALRIVSKDRFFERATIEPNLRDALEMNPLINNHSSMIATVTIGSRGHRVLQVTSEFHEDDLDCIGYIETHLENLAGEEVTFSDGTMESLSPPDMTSFVKHHAGDAPIVFLPPKRTYIGVFRPLGRISSVNDVKPGRYKSYAVLRYIAASERCVTVLKSNSINVEVTDAHVREWRAYLARR
jgi:hypothetical protein